MSLTDNHSKILEKAVWLRHNGYRSDREIILQPELNLYHALGESTTLTALQGTQTNVNILVKRRFS